MKYSENKFIIVAMALSAFVMFAGTPVASAQQAGTYHGAPVGDFFAAVNAFDQHLAQQQANNSSNSANTNAGANSYNPIAFNNYIPNNGNTSTSPSSNTSQLVTNDTNNEDTRLALAGSASLTSGRYENEVKFNNDNPQSFQTASAFGARNANSPLNSGALLLVLLLVLVVMFVARRYYGQKARYSQSYAGAAHYRDMNRYHARYAHRV